jgi:hypothetical protein
VWLAVFVSLANIAAIQTPEKCCECGEPTIAYRSFIQKGFHRLFNNRVEYMHYECLDNYDYERFYGMNIAKYKSMATNGEAISVEVVNDVYSITVKRKHGSKTFSESARLSGDYVRSQWFSDAIEDKLREMIAKLGEKVAASKKKSS